MKKLTLRRIALQNFKGFSNFEIELHDGVNVIAGRNESGKTTLLDAFMWCLFNKDHLYRTAFAIKTHDSEGNDIPNLEHSVELVIDVDGTERTLRRVLKERWTKPRGQVEPVLSGNYQECYVDGQMLSSADFGKYVSGIIDEEVFKCVTSPTYFLSLPWQQKRSFLQQMAGKISEVEITGGDSKFDDLLAAMREGSIEDYSKHTRYNMREVRKLLDEIPVRLAEQEKALPERKDWESVETELKTRQAELDCLTRKAAETAAMSPAEIRRREIQAEIDRQKTVLEERKRVVESKYRAMLTEAQSRYRKAQSDVSQNNAAIAEIQMMVAQRKSEIQTAQDRITALRNKVEPFREKWKLVSSKKFSVPSDIGICPACGQYIPEDQRQAKIEEMRAKFNEEKASELESLRNEAAAIKKAMSAAEEQVARCKADIERCEAGMSELEEKNRKLGEVTPYTELQYTDLLIDDDLYTEADEKIHALTQSLADARDAEPFAPKTDYEGQSAALREQVRELTMVLATKVQYTKGMALIEDIKTQQRDLSEQLAALEKAEDALNEYTERLDNLLEEKVNGHFSLVRWRMFRNLVNGAREPYCECMLNGTDAGNGLNSAGVIQAGIDICHAVSKYYDVSAPIMTDNAESINEENFPDPTGQEIRLYVSEDEKLTLR